MPADTFDLEKFEKKWTKLGKKICQAIYVSPQIQRIKRDLQKNHSLSDGQINDFINICNKLKYQMIYKEFGEQGTKAYDQFSRHWQMWFEQKGLDKKKNHTQRNSVEHVLMGSTPDPAVFLLRFEEEMLGSMKYTRTR